jgi:mannose-6-phosphate isomerase-like protein (cupin superfamily)
MTDWHAPVIARADPGSRPWNLLVGAPETDGLVMVGMGTLPPATAGPPLHVHAAEDEGFVVVSGLLTARCGEQTVELRPWEMIWLPRKVPHTFANLSDEPTTIVSIVAPGGLSQMFREQDDYLRDTTEAPDPAALQEISERYGVVAVGPPLL